MGKSLSQLQLASFLILNRETKLTSGKKRKILVCLALIGSFFSYAQPGDYLKFDGVNDYVSLPAPTSLPTGNSSYTIEAWVKPTVQSAFSGIIGWGLYGASGQVNALKINTYGSITNYWWGGGSYDLTVPFSFILNQWYHVAATYDGTTRKIYIDGTLIGQDTPPSHSVPVNYVPEIGRTNSTEYFNGGMDELRIWNIAVPQSDIARRRFCELSGLESGLVAYYKFNQGTAGINNTSISTLDNSTATSNNGTFSSNFVLNGTSSNFLAGSPVLTGSIYPSTPPTLPSPQPSPNLYTVGDLIPAQNSTTAWYNFAEGGTALSNSTVLECGTTYYCATLNANGCESERVPYTHNNLGVLPDVVVCEGVSTNITFPASCANTYSWTNDNTAIGLAASGTGSITSFIPVNTTSSPITATITVTPQITSITNTTQTFNAIAAEETWTVPSGVDTVNIVCIGASGQSSLAPVGYASGKLPVGSGATLYINVGGAGNPNFATSSYNGGYYNGTASGGGASDVRLGGNSLADRVIVAYGTGGVSSGGQWGNYAEDGKHATISGPGNGGGGTAWGQAGGLGLGGVSAVGSGGGGGGFYGGGGGGDNPGPGNNGAGGNGSNYTGGVLNGLSSTGGTNSGGSVTISYPNTSIIDGTPFTFTITVNPSAHASIVSSDSDNSICSGDEVIFTATTTNEGTSPTYEWFLNGNPIAGQNGITYTTSTLANNAVISFELTSTSAGCNGNASSNSISTTINLYQTAEISLSSSDADNSICEGTNVTFTANPVFGGNAPTYAWYLNNNLIIGQISGTFNTTSLVNSDEIYLEMTSNYPCLINPIALISNGIVTSVDSVTTSSTTVNTPASSYNWNGTNLTTSGSYTQSLVNAAGCDSIATLNLTLNVIGLNELSNSTIQVYPNPAHDKVNITFEGTSTVSIDLMDINGKLVATNTGIQSGDVISIEHLEKGVYLMLVKSTEGSFIERLIKQ